MKLKGKDMSASLRKTAQNCMPEFKKGGAVKKFAMGGSVAGVRKGSASPNGTPIKPTIPSAKSKMVTPKFKGKVGVGS